MLETSVVRAWEHQVSQAKLFDTVQPLHLWTMQQLQEYTVHLNASMHTVMDYLALGHGHDKEKR